MDYSNIDAPIFGDDLKVVTAHLPVSNGLPPSFRYNGRSYYLHYFPVADELLGWPHYTRSRIETASSNALAKYYNRAAAYGALARFEPEITHNLKRDGWDEEEDDDVKIGKLFPRPEGAIPVFSRFGDFIRWAEPLPTGALAPLYRLGKYEYQLFGMFTFRVFADPKTDKPTTSSLGYFHPNSRVDPKKTLEDFLKLERDADMVINRITHEAVAQFRALVSVSEEANSLDAYQNIAQRSAIYPGKGTPQGLLYVALKMNGEAGEFAEHVGKAMRDDGFAQIDDHGEQSVPLSAERRALLVKEIGDELWYLAAAAKELGIPLSEAAAVNLEKLADRTERDKLSGSGDER